MPDTSRTTPSHPDVQTLAMVMHQKVQDSKPGSSRQVSFEARLSDFVANVDPVLLRYRQSRKQILWSLGQVANPAFVHFVDEKIPWRCILLYYKRLAVPPD